MAWLEVDVYLIASYSSEYYSQLLPSFLVCTAEHFAFVCSVDALRLRSFRGNDMTPNDKICTGVWFLSDWRLITISHIL